MVTQAKLSDVPFKGGGKRRVRVTLEADVHGENDLSGKMDMHACA